MNSLRAFQRGLLARTTSTFNFTREIVAPSCNSLAPYNARYKFSSEAGTRHKAEKNQSADVVHPADGKFNYGYMDEDVRFKGDKPTIAYAKTLPRSFSMMRHEQILQLKEEGSAGACREALIRNIMSVDEIEYDEAVKVFDEIAKVNRDGMVVHYLPYQIGAIAAVTAGTISFPLIFDLQAVSWFNTNYVTADVPEPKDLETFLEVGSWSWNWMEPVLGQISFVLLTAQFTRSQMLNLGISPYGNFMKRRRADRLIKKFPQYDEDFVRSYSYSTTLYAK